MGVEIRKAREGPWELFFEGKVEDLDKIEYEMWCEAIDRAEEAERRLGIPFKEFTEGREIVEWPYYRLETYYVIFRGGGDEEHEIRKPILEIKYMPSERPEFAEVRIATVEYLSSPDP
jgi:hypothetical protein